MYRNDYGRTGDYSPYDIKGTKNIKWIYNTKSKVDVSIIHNEDKLYFVDKNSTFYCLDSKTGKEIWKNEMKEYYSGSSAVVYKDMVIYNGGKLIAFNKYNGKLLWESNNGPYVYGEPIVVNDKIYVNTWPEIPEQQNYLYCFDVNTGKILWQHENGEGAACTESSAYSDGILYYGLVDGNFYAFNINSKKVIWKVHYEKDQKIKTPIIDRENIIVPCKNTASNNTLTLYIYNRNNGKLINKISEQMIYLKEIFAYNGKVYLFNGNRELFIIDYINNTKEIRNDLKNYSFDYILGSKNSLLFVGSKELVLYSVIEKNILDIFTNINGIITGIPTIKDNVIYFGTFKGVVYAIE